MLILLQERRELIALSFERLDRLGESLDLGVRFTVERVSRDTERESVRERRGETD